jgi:hypothetical protein
MVETLTSRYGARWEPYLVDERPAFVQPFAQHVRDWRRAMHREFWATYDADPDFRQFLELWTWRNKCNPTVPYRGFYD